MNLKRRTKILVFLFTFGPAYFLVADVTLFPEIMSGEFMDSENPLQGLLPFICVHAVAALWFLSTFAFYAVYLYKTDRVPAERKLLWATLIVLGHTVSMLVFWYLYIWRDRREKSHPVAD